MGLSADSELQSEIDRLRLRNEQIQQEKVKFENELNELSRRNEQLLQEKVKLRNELKLTQRILIETQGIVALHEADKTPTFDISVEALKEFTVWFRNFPFFSNVGDVRSFFLRNGIVIHSATIFNCWGSTVHGFVHMHQKSETRDAVSATNGKTFGANIIYVSLSPDSLSLPPVAARIVFDTVEKNKVAKIVNKSKEHD